MSESSLKARAETASLLRQSYGAQADLAPSPKLPVGISAIDLMTGGLPGGAITEIVGPASSGKTTFMLSVLETATRSDLCALVDASDSFDVISADDAGVVFNNLLWVRCKSDIDKAIKVTELLLRGGLFSLVVLDLGNVPIKYIKRIESATWLRFRRGLENTSNALLVIAQQSCAQSFAGLVLEMNKEKTVFSLNGGQNKKNNPPFANLLQGLQLRTGQSRPFAFNAKADFYASIPYR